MRNLRLLPKQEIVPFEYQLECLEILEHTEKIGKKEALVILASGLGKTILSALFVQRRFKSPEKIKCLFLSHQTDALEQALLEFDSVFSDTIAYGVFHGTEKNYHDVNILFASFQTMRLNLSKFDPKEFDVIIIDETHHVYAETYLQVVDYFKPAFLLGITATPDRLDDLDIRDIYGDPVYTLSLVDALARGLLTPVDYRLMSDEIMSQKIIETPHGRMGIRSLNTKVFMPKRDEEIVAIIKKHMAEISNPRVMIFCSSISHAEQIAAMIPGAVPLHSQLSKAEKQVRLELFRQGMFQVVTTVDMFNESINIPEANMIVFLRSTSSPTVYFQQLGRGLRKHKNKSRVIILDFAGNCERVSLVYELWQSVQREVKKLNRSRRRHRRRYGSIDPFFMNVDNVAFREKIIPLLELIERFKREPYKTWEEASVAALGLGITAQREYFKSSYKDSHLPSNPRQYYKDFPGWLVFFEKPIKTFYPNLNEARDASLKLGIRGKVDYNERFKADPKLPSRPDAIYSTEWKGWRHFLTGKKREIYKTLEEASIVVKKFCFKSSEDYVENYYKHDTSLVREPNKYYSDWKSWNNFLGLPEKIPYYSFSEAKKVAQALGINTQDEYLIRYKEDPKLPSQPNQVYKEWKGMNDFLGTIRFSPKREYYPTIQEASEAAIALGIKNVKDYMKKYKQDPKLSGTPSRVYGDEWKGWSRFLDKRYFTWQEASVSAIALGITSKEDYSAKYKQDPKLPATPRERYKNFPGWLIFLKKSKQR